MGEWSRFAAYNLVSMPPSGGPQSGPCRRSNQLKTRKLIFFHSSSAEDNIESSYLDDEGNLGIDADTDIGFLQEASSRVYLKVSEEELKTRQQPPHQKKGFCKKHQERLVGHPSSSTE